MFVEIVKVEKPTTAPGKNGTSYQSVEVVYKDGNNKVQGKKLVSFQYPEVFNKIVTANAGDKFDITSEKKDKYWNWVAIKDASGNTVTAEASEARPKWTPGKVTGSNYETPEQREINRKHITRQACLNTAVAFLSVVGDKKIEQDRVIEVAGKFEQWVKRDDRRDAEAALSNMQDDIPVE